MKKILCTIIFSCILFSLISPNFANASVSLNISGKNIPKTKVLIGINYKNHPQFGSPKADTDAILSKVKRNLKSTDLFEFKENDLISSVTINDASDDLSIEKVPNFIKYSASGIEMLLAVDASFNQIGELEIKTRLWDAMDERQLFGKFYAANKGNYKKLSSLISDEIFKATSGDKVGHFDSRITYIAESGGALKRIKRIAVMDFDGENHRYLTNGRDLVLTPVFAKNRNEIFFVRFYNEKPQIYNLDIGNALLRKVGGFRGTTFAPTVSSKDPNLLAFSVIEHGNSNIYQMNLFTNEIDRLTSTRAIDTTPSYSPDGKYIVFSSDRSGNEQLYIMDSDGGRAKKISFDGGSYSKPMWSPDGKFIAFTKLKANQFHIGVIDTDGRNEKILTSGYLVEGAKWSPSGRYIIYSRKNGAYGKASVPKLFLIDTITGFEREIQTPGNEGATDPDWAMN